MTDPLINRIFQILSIYRGGSENSAVVNTVLINGILFTYICILLSFLFYNCTCVLSFAKNISTVRDYLEIHFINYYFIAYLDYIAPSYIISILKFFKYRFFF